MDLSAKEIIIGLVGFDLALLAYLAKWIHRAVSDNTSRIIRLEAKMQTICKDK